VALIRLWRLVAELSHKTVFNLVWLIWLLS
jgi:hypothetical protein